MLTEQELARLESAKSEEEWIAICLEIANAHGGDYPRDWEEKVMNTDLQLTAQQRHGW